MFDEAKKQSLAQGQSPSHSRMVFRGLPVDDLIRYHDEIRALLPPLNLSEMNLEEEMLLQYHALRAVQNNVLSNDEVAVNQQAQMANSVGSLLARLAELQVSVYTSERFKRIENLLIRSMRQLPEDRALAFLDEYEKSLKSLR